MRLSHLKKKKLLFSPGSLESHILRKGIAVTLVETDIQTVHVTGNWLSANEHQFARHVSQASWSRYSSPIQAFRWL